MKNILILALALLALPLLAKAQPPIQTWIDPLPGGSTNTITADVSAGNSATLQVAFTGQGAGLSQVALGLTNAPSADNTLTVSWGTNTTVYTWKAVPVTTTNTLTDLAPVVILGVTADQTNGDTLTIVKGQQTNTWIWTNIPTVGMWITTNSTPAIAATNLYSALVARFPESLGISMLSATQIKYVGRATENWQPTNSSNWGTNQLTSVYLTTNTAPLNTYQVQLTNVALATTNLYTRLIADLPNLSPTLTGSNVITINPLDGTLVGLAATGTWRTNLITTNTMIGYVKFQASNSVDGLYWVADSTRNFAVPYSTTSAVVYQTNIVNLYGNRFLRFSVENARTNYAHPLGLKINASVKAGF